jgi:hypothetical protein
MTSGPFFLACSRAAGGRLWKFKLSEVDDWVRAGSVGKENNGRSEKPT